MIIAIVASLFCITGNASDVVESEIAFKHGAVERNWPFTGERPATWKVTLFNVATFAPGIVLSTNHNPALFGVGIGWLLASGVKHFIGFLKARSWNKANA